MDQISRRLMLSMVILGAGGAAVAQDNGRMRRRWSRQRPGAGSTQARQRVSFGADPRQVYDLYGTSEGPILAYVHGGGWSRGDPSAVHELPAYADRHGLVLASIGYRLVPRVTPREQGQDIAAAIADLRRTYPGRPLYLLGHSAGAHLAALVGIDPSYLQAQGMAPSDLAGVILLDGAGYDATGDRGEGPAGRMLGAMYEQAFGDQAAALSPTLLVGAGQTYPPFLIFHIASRADARDQSRRLAEALRQVGGWAEVNASPSDSHREINVGFGVPGDPEGERTARFIGSGGR